MTAFMQVYLLGDRSLAGYISGQIVLRSMEYGICAETGIISSIRHSLHFAPHTLFYCIPLQIFFRLSLIYKTIRVSFSIFRSHVQHVQIHAWDCKHRPTDAGIKVFSPSSTFSILLFSTLNKLLSPPFTVLLSFRVIIYFPGSTM